MSDVNVRFKMSADTSQLQKDLKNTTRLVEQEMRELGMGNNSNGNKGSQSKQNSESSSTSSSSSQSNVPREDAKDKATRERALDVNEDISKELTLVRKELQKLNENGGFSGGGATPTSGQPSGNNGSGTPNVPTGDGNKLGSAIGKIATAASVIAVASRLIGQLNRGAQSTAQAESLAYETYGSSLYYSDYFTAKKDAYNAGKDYGYSHDAVMSANSAFMQSGAGWDEENNWSDMNRVLSTAKYFGLDASSVGQSMGTAAGYGISPTEYQTLLVNTIDRLGLQGRENVAEDALDDIISLLEQTNKNITDEGVTGTLKLWNMLAEGNGNLSGQQGAQMAADLQSSLANSTNGFALMGAAGGNITSMEDYYNARMKLATGDTAENLTNTLQQITQNLNEKDYDTEYERANLIGMALGWGGVGSMSAEQLSQASEYAKNWDAIISGEYGISTEDLTNSENAEGIVGEHAENYDNSDVKKQEQWEIEKQDTSEDFGHGWNSMWNPLRSLFNGQNDGMQDFLGGTFAVGTAAAGTLGTKAILGKLFGTGASAAAGAEGTAAAGGIGGTLSSIGSSISSGLSSLGSTIQSGAASAAESISAAATAFDVSAAGTAVTNFAAAGGMELLGAVAPFAPALPDAMRTWGQMADDDKEWSGLSDTEKERRTFTGESLNNTGLFTGWNTVGSKAGRDGIEYLEDLQDNIQSGTNDWVKDWVNTYWKEFDGQLSSAYDNKMEEILRELGIDIGQDSWSSVSDVETALSGLSEEDKKKILGANATMYDKNTSFQRISYAAGSENDITYDLQKALVDEYNKDDEYKSYQYRMKEVFESHGMNIDELTNSEIEDYLKDALGDSYQKTGAQWWKYGDGDDAKYGKNGSIYFNERFKTESFDTLLGDLASSWTEQPATQENTEAVSDLTTEVSEMRKWLEEHGHSGTAVWTDETVKETYNSELSELLGNTSGGNSLTTNPMRNLLGLGNNSGTRKNAFSHATGNDYVPYDNYEALLHKGEMVLTADEATDYRSGRGLGNNSGMLDININITGGIEGMTDDNQQQIVAAILTQLQGGGNALQGMLSNSFARVQNY